MKYKKSKSFQFTITIDRHSTVPIYMQIVNFVRNSIHSGKIKGGFRLPTVRKLSQITGLSVGTIRRAYDELQKLNVIKMTQGKGTFVIDKDEAQTLGKRERAVSAVEFMVTELLDLGYTYNDITLLTEHAIKKRMELNDKTKVAVVDCNTESMSVIVNQLSDFPEICITEFLLDVVLETPVILMDNYKVIVTTHTHFELLSEALGESADKLTKVVMTPSEQTIVDLAAIKEGAVIGIWCKTKRFLRITQEGIRKFAKNVSGTDYRLKDEDFLFSKFLDSLDVLVVSPCYLQYTEGEDLEDIEHFVENGGTIVQYNYQIDKGSLMFLSDRINSFNN